MNDDVFTTPPNRCDVAVKSIPQNAIQVVLTQNAHNFCIEIELWEKNSRNICGKACIRGPLCLTCRAFFFLQELEKKGIKSTIKRGGKQIQRQNEAQKNWYQPRRRQRLKNHNWKSATHFAGQNITIKNGKVHTKLRQMRTEKSERTKKPNRLNRNKEFVHTQRRIYQ